MSGQLTLGQKLSAKLDQLAADIDSNRLQIPSPPENLIELRRLVQQDASIDEIAALLNKEPHLSARLIKLANSVLFGGRQHVATVKMAVVRLGTQKVSNLVNGIAISQAFINHKTVGIEQALSQSWHHSHQVAAIASTLARYYCDIDPDQALLAGQIHNIGETPLLLHINTLYELKPDPKLKQQVINKVLDKLAARVSSTILRRWLFPEEMIQLPYATRLHHLNKDKPDLNQLIQLGIMLKSHNFMRELKQLPPDLLSRPAFSQLWRDEQQALQQLNGVAPDIVATHQLLHSG